MTWQTTPATGLEQAIADFKAALPGWWFSMGECQVSCDASCAPTPESPHLALIPQNEAFNSGFHADIPQPSTLADALRDVMEQALKALESTIPPPQISAPFEAISGSESTAQQRTEP